MNLYLIPVVLYIVVMAGIAIERGIKIRDQKNFMVGGREVSTLMILR